MVHKQIVIVGGGPIGLTSAILLSKLGYKITIFDDHFQKQSHDFRVLAISYASCNVLRKIGVWNHEIATPINQVHISHSGLGVSSITHKDVSLPELGYTIKYSDLCNSLKEKVIKDNNIEVVPHLVNEVIPGKNFSTIIYEDDGSPEHLTSDLVVMAEGGRIKLAGIDYTEYDYHQKAIIAHLHCKSIAKDTAFERFDNSGALVLLPYKDYYVLVWTKPENKADYFLKSNNLLAELSKLGFMKRFSEISLDKEIHSFPLKLRVAKKRILDRVVLLGNSAQVLHPVSAQGLNLGLRDIDKLSEILGNEKNLHDIQNKLILYNQLRQKDSQIVIGFTHFIAKFFEKQSPILNKLRGLGLIGLSNCKIAQNKLAKSLIFGA